MKRNILLTAIMLGLCGQLHSATPTLMNYQGRLTTAGGTAVPDGSYSVVFTIYDAATGGTIIWTETQSVTTSSGLFAVLLGSVNPVTDTVFNSDTRYLGTKVGADPELIPRTRLVSVPYADRVNTIDGSTGGSVSGNITIENSSATSGLVLKGSARFLHNFGANNTFLGENSGNLSMTGFQNTVTGSGSFQSNTSGSYNIAIGGSALANNTSGDNNTAVGINTLLLNTVGIQNTASGANALQNNSFGSGNTATGFDALFGNTGAPGNTATGSFALYANTSGEFNSATGNQALVKNSQGNQNTAFGVGALWNNTTGSFNTACGSYALQSGSTGNENTAIGAYTNVTSGNLSNATVIGYNATVNASNKIRLGNTSVTVIEGQVAYTFTSDRNQKENFQPVDGEDVLRKIRSLSLTSWNYKENDPATFRHYGPMAQDFYEAFGHDGVGTCGDSVSINSGDMAGITLIAVQTLEREKEQLKAKVETIQTENAELKARLANVEAALNKLMSQ